MTDWSNFVNAAVSRYPWVRYWTIWNEPNDSTFYIGSPYDYVQLVNWAAPAIRANADGQGARHLVAGELSQRDVGAWVDVLVDSQSQNIDVLSTHTYGDTGSAEILAFARRAKVVASGKPVWLTEANETGCRNNPGFQGTAACVDVNGIHNSDFSLRIYIDDDVQAAYADSVIAHMRRSGTAWSKTFLYDASSEVEDDSSSQDYGTFGGYVARALYAKSVYYHLAAANGLAASATMSGPTALHAGSSGTFTVTLTGGHVGLPYYYEWHVSCNARSSPDGDCVGEDEVWEAGWGLNSITIAPPIVDGTMTVIAYVRDTEIDSPVAPAYAAKGAKKLSLYRF